MGRLVQLSQNTTAVRRNPIGIIPKPHQPGKFCLMVDLSAPPAFSVNDGRAVFPGLCLRIDQAAQLVSKYGQGH